MRLSWKFWVVALLLMLLDAPLWLSLQAAETGFSVTIDASHAQPREVEEDHHGGLAAGLWAGLADDGPGHGREPSGTAQRGLRWNRQR